MSEQKFIHLIVERQDSPQSSPYTEEFKVPYRKNMNVISTLMEVQKNPVNAKGHRTTPVVWECNCLEEVCGACSMVVNGKPQQACTALIDKLEQPIRLAPLSSFQIIRDLMIDRQVMFDSLKKVKAWIPIDGTYDLGPGPRFAERERQWAYELSKCMTCGCCMEACPNFNERSEFIGPAPINQVRLFNVHPTGAMNKEERLESIMGRGGITDCGNSQNCVQACPKEIPLTTSLADLNKQTTKHAFKNWLTKE
ncbi:succinate dehydrogenase iron-sulfur subunit [Desulfuribacillus alkaliarsenatis]|uniref:succinate dehydrogenase n=1 Tax=Desulfuribacillus alkaliarsenatis TaxID=766136 RepID=A0A1E5G510_9FIRM|nr:succinate dehydrogenase iron-sulfur subunit [Desulfuribacillus alkaliarsenatis]OEF98267.1 succinate dehydrogenase iron-sulfur subunit [Desulfuribacillus alkaliarsenatis]